MKRRVIELNEDQERKLYELMCSDALSHLAPAPLRPGMKPPRAGMRDVVAFAIEHTHESLLSEEGAK